MREHEVLVFLYRDQSVLALHRSAAQGAYWHSVAGGVEPDEDTPAAAVRELAEETGLHSKTVRPLGHSYVYGETTVTCFANSLAERTESATPERIDSTQG